MAHFEKLSDFFKVDGEGIAYGWAIVCTEGGKPYVDLQGDHIPESAMLAAAEDFAKNSRVAKDMHDGSQIGEFPFLYPVTKSSKDLGIDSTRTGLLVGFKPTDPEMLKLIASGHRTGFSIGGYLSESTDEAVGKIAKSAKPTGRKARVFRAFKIQEISLVDRPAQEGATVGYVKRVVVERTDKAPALFPRVAKLAVLTDEIDGHQHVIDLEDPFRGWSSYQTSYQTSEGATEGHSHAWTFDALTRAITIAADSGHTHSIVAVVPMPLQDDAIPEALPVEESSGAVVTISVAARAPQVNSTLQAPAITVASQGKETAMDPKDQKISELEKMISRLTKQASLTDAQRAHLGTLAGDDAEAFLAKSNADREAIVKAAVDADPVVYTTQGGLALRKSAGDIALMLAKQADASAKDAAEAKAAVLKAMSDADQVRLEKRASTELSHFAKAVGVSAAILKAVDGIADEKIRGEAIEALKGANVALVELGKDRGYNPGGDAVSDQPLAKFNAKLVEYAKAVNKAPALATVEFLNTPEGAALYADVSANTAQA